MRAHRPDRRRLARLALGASLAPLGLTLPGCASLPDGGSAQARELIARPPVGLPRAALLADTPFFPQTELQCGPASLATLLQAIGRPVTPEQLTPQLFVPERGGSLQLEMLAAPRRHDALAVRLPERLDAALRELASGRAIGVMQNLGLDWAPRWHFAVLIGFDLDRREAVLRSGTTREQRLDLLTFERTWARSGRWAFVVVPPGEVPETASVTALRDSCLGFERVAPLPRAIEAWQAAARRWPGDLVLGMGWGNALARAERLEAAEQAFAQVAEATDGAAAWNNLAQVRLQRRQLPAAREAARRAVLRAAAAEPTWLDAARTTLGEVEDALRPASQP